MKEFDDLRILEIQIAGRDTKLWNKLRDKFMTKLEGMVENLLDQIVDPQKNTTLREESKQIISLGLDYFKNKLANPGIENEKVLAEIEEIYINMEKTAAETRKIKAEAETIEFNNSLKKLEFCLHSTKILLLDSEDQDEKSLVFIKQIDAWIQFAERIKVI